GDTAGAGDQPSPAPALLQPPIGADETHVAGQREVEPKANSGAIHRRDDRDRRCLDTAHHRLDVSVNVIPKGGMVHARGDLGEPPQITAGTEDAVSDEDYAVRCYAGIRDRFCDFPGVLWRQRITL